MIVVIADDFTGAAEIGGIGIKHGLKVLVQTEIPNLLYADMIVVVANTRTMSPEDADRKIREIAHEFKDIQPEFLFKKIDSALRGNILVELKAQMEVLGLNRTLIVSGNPIFDRIIKDGRYYINNVPIDQTSFSSDNYFPIKTSSVLEILDPRNKYNLINMKHTDQLPQEGIVVGDVSSNNDLIKWAEGYTENTFYAGASGFFDALLRTIGPVSKPHRPGFPFGNKILYVGGTSYPKKKEFNEKMKNHGVYTSNIPIDIYSDKYFHPERLDEWADDIVEKFQTQNVFVTMQRDGSNEQGLSDRLCKNLGELIWKVAERVILDELVIEGGDTSFVVLELLKIRKLRPVQVFGPGVVRMEVIGNRNFYITTKPGSYDWPNEIMVARNIQKRVSAR